jgi:hypothetical protein
MSAFGWRRLWQPRNPLFWLVLGLNVLSSVLVLGFHTLPLADTPRLLLGLLALVDTLLGWWLLRRLWLEGGVQG